MMSIDTYTACLALIPEGKDRVRLELLQDRGQGTIVLTEHYCARDGSRRPFAHSRVISTPAHVTPVVICGQPPKTILITSSQPSEGKTTTAINTAFMMAQTEPRL
jgi:Mrp family chromosome partitioning ATPase